MVDKKWIAGYGLGAAALFVTVAKLAEKDEPAKQKTHVERVAKSANTDEIGQLSMEQVEAEYKGIYDHIKSKRDLATKEKPLLIVIGEEHHYRSSLLCQIMAIDAGVRLGAEEFNSEQRPDLTPLAVNQQKAYADSYSKSGDKFIRAMSLMPFMRSIGKSQIDPVSKMIVEEVMPNQYPAQLIAVAANMKVRGIDPLHGMEGSSKVGAPNVPQREEAMVKSICESRGFKIVVIGASHYNSVLDKLEQTGQFTLCGMRLDTLGEGLGQTSPKTYQGYETKIPTFNIPEGQVYYMATLAALKHRHASNELTVEQKAYFDTKIVPLAGQILSGEGQLR